MRSILEHPATGAAPSACVAHPRGTGPLPPCRLRRAAGDQHVVPALAARYRNAKDNPFPTEMAWSSPVWVANR